MQPQYGLYNGNIAAWTTRTRDDVPGNQSPGARATGEQYRYDQLNRIKSSDFYRLPLGGGVRFPESSASSE